MTRTILLLLVAVCYFYKAASQNTDTIYTETRIIPCVISLVNDDEVLYSSIQDNKRSGGVIPMSEIMGLFIEKNSKAIININDDALKQRIFYDFRENLNLPVNPNLSLIDNVEFDAQYEIIFIKDNLALHHNQFQVGTILLFVGTGLSIMSSIIINEPKVLTGALIISGLLSSAGVIIQIDSHKYFKRASIKRRYKEKSPNIL